jgi:hypothetical protein
MRSKKAKRQGAKAMHGNPVSADQESFATKPAKPDGAHGTGKSPAPELDLDRLVWDPEYRKAMLPVIKRGA